MNRDMHQSSVNGIDRLAAIFKSVDWVVPAYLPNGVLSYCTAMIERAPDPQKQAVLATVLRTIYDERHFATFVPGLYPNTRNVRDFRPQIEEAVAAWFMGLYHAAVATIVPVLEGVIRKIAQESHREVGNGTKKVIAELDFFSDRLLIHTDDYEGLDQLNRHGILHGIFEQYGNAINFLRLITLLELLCLAMVLAHGGSLFAPAYTPEAQNLAERFRRLKQLAPWHNS